MSAKKCLTLSGFQNGRTWAVYEKMYRTPLIPAISISPFYCYFSSNMILYVFLPITPRKNYGHPLLMAGESTQKMVTVPILFGPGFAVLLTGLHGLQCFSRVWSLWPY